MNVAASLDGCWRRIRSDPPASVIAKDVIVEFTSDGGLIYSIVEETRVQKIFLRYYLEGNEIVTDQLSDPHVERTRFKLDGRKMTLENDNHVEVYEEIERTKADEIIAQVSKKL